MRMATGVVEYPRWQTSSALERIPLVIHSDEENRAHLNLVNHRYLGRWEPIHVYRNQCYKQRCYERKLRR